MNTRHYIRKTGAWTLTAVLGLATLCGCSDDTVAYSEDGLLSGSGAKAYMTLTLSMSNATRSATDTPTGADYGTSSDGTEAALSSESYVSNALVVFTTDGTSTTSDNPYPIVDAFVGSSPELKSTTDGSIVYEITIEIPEDADLSSATNVFVFCNPTDQQIEKATGTTATWTAKDTYSLDEVDAVAPWQEGNIFMSSAVLSTVTIPEDLSPYTEKKPLELGTVKVERSVARFDYKDGAPEGNDPFTYTILSHDGVPQLNVELQEIALFDMSKEFYHLRQGTAGANGMSSAQSSPLLTETSTNWVCDPNFAEKETATSDESELEIADLFVSPLSQPSTWEWAKLSELTTDGGATDYKIWRYSTENCPTSASNQRRGNTTGVVFKGEIIAPENSDYTLDGTSRIYHFEQYFFTSWDKVKSTATEEGAEEEHPDLVAAYEKVMEVWTSDKNEEDEEVVEAMAAAGFTGYAPDNGHYYVYYYYWNRHNDNGDNEEMGNMEFAVVRNNVYGLSVTAIHELGHPEPYDDYYDENVESEVQPESLTRADAIHFHHTPDAYPIILLDPCEEVTFITVGLHILPWIADHEAEVSLPTADPSSKNE